MVEAAEGKLLSARRNTRTCSDTCKDDQERDKRSRKAHYSPQIALPFSAQPPSPPARMRAGIDACVRSPPCFNRPQCQCRSLFRFDTDQLVPSDLSSLCGTLRPAKTCAAPDIESARSTAAAPSPLGNGRIGTNCAPSRKRLRGREIPSVARICGLNVDMNRCLVIPHWM
jgi:hypothetical protein